MTVIASSLLFWATKPLHNGFTLDRKLTAKIIYHHILSLSKYEYFSVTAGRNVQQTTTDHEQTIPKTVADEDPDQTQAKTLAWEPVLVPSNVGQLLSFIAITGTNSISHYYSC